MSLLSKKINYCLLVLLIGSSFIFNLVDAYRAQTSNQNTPNCSTTVVATAAALTAAIEQAAPGAVICIQPSNGFKANISINKSITLVGRQASIEVENPRKPIIDVRSATPINVLLQGLILIGTGKSKGYNAEGILVSGKAVVTLINVRMVHNAYGIRMQSDSQTNIRHSAFSQNCQSIFTEDSAQLVLDQSYVQNNDPCGPQLQLLGNSKVKIINSDISNNPSGVFAAGNGKVEVLDSVIWGHDTEGIIVRSDVLIMDSVVGHNRAGGIQVSRQGQLKLKNSTVQSNGFVGISIREEGSVDIEDSVIERTGLIKCVEPISTCNGIELSDKAKLRLHNAIIRKNADWGIGVNLRICHHFPEVPDDFSGNIVFEGKNVVEQNNRSERKNGRGNPGNHAYKNLPDGQVCLP